MGIKKAVVVLFCILCLTGCKEEEKHIADHYDLTKVETPKYKCEKCGRISNTIGLIITSGKETSMFCQYCIKEYADKYLPKVKKVK